MRKLTAVALLVGMMAFGAAHADTVTKKDPQGDTDSRYDNPADIRSATAGHTKTGKLKHTIVLWNKVTELNRPFVGIATNTAVATCEDSPFRGELLDIGSSSGDVEHHCGGPSPGTFRVKRPNAHTIVYIFSKKVLVNRTGDPTRKYFWAIYHKGDEAPDHSSFFMPEFDSYGVKHRL